MEWIKGEQLSDGSVKIKGTIYKNDSEYFIKDGWVFCRDRSHQGTVYFTAEIAKKYGLEWCQIDADELAEDVEFFDHDPALAYNLAVEHVHSTLNGDGEKAYMATPHWGETYSQTFVAWRYGFHPALFDEEEGVEIRGWCGG